MYSSPRNPRIGTEVNINDGLHSTGKVFNGGKESNAKRSSDDREEKWQAFEL